MDPFEKFESQMSGGVMDMYAAQLHEFYLAFIRAGFEETQATTFVGLLVADDIKRARGER